MLPNPAFGFARSTSLGLMITMKTKNTSTGLADTATLATVSVEYMNVPIAAKIRHVVIHVVATTGIRIL